MGINTATTVKNCQQSRIKQGAKACRPVQTFMCVNINTSSLAVILNRPVYNVVDTQWTCPNDV